MFVHEIDWRDVTPPGCHFEIHATHAPSDGRNIYRHRQKPSGIGSEPRSSHMVVGQWKNGLPVGVTFSKEQ